MPLELHIYICIYIYICMYVYTVFVLSLQSDTVSRPYHLAIGPKVDGQHVLSMHLFFYIVDRWSVEKLTGSIYRLVLCLLRFRSLVAHEVDVHV